MSRYRYINFFLNFRNLFNNLTELRELYLQNNKLSSLSPFIFSPLTHLRTIWISNNSVTMEGPRQNVSSLYNCHNIENIHATNNSISRIYDDWIEKDEKLNVLDLKSNPMSETKVTRFVENFLKWKIK